jgi:hypothetical protein
LPESQYKYQLSKINNRTKKNAIKTLLKEATYFKYIKIQLNNETVIYDMDTLEQVKYEPSKFKTHTLEKDSASFDQIKESKIVRSKEGLFGSSINYTSIKCIEKIVSLKLSNDTVIKVRLAKDRKNILYRNSISLVDIGDIKIITLHGALVRKEIIEVAFNKDLKQTKTT